MSQKRPPKPVAGNTKLAHELDAIVDSVGKKGSGWESIDLPNISSITDEPGVYLFTLPSDDRHGQGSLILHGRTFGRKKRRRQLRIKFTYSAQKLEGTNRLVLYVGKAANLRSRLKNHLNTRDDSTTSQMLRGIASQAVYHGEEPDVQSALDHIQKVATIYFYTLGHANEQRHDPRGVDDVGESFAADRDLLEIKLIAKFAPPFNIKAER